MWQKINEILFQIKRILSNNPQSFDSFLYEISEKNEYDFLKM